MPPGQFGRHFLGNGRRTGELTRDFGRKKDGGCGHRSCSSVKWPQCLPSACRRRPDWAVLWSSRPTPSPRGHRNQQLSNSNQLRQPSLRSTSAANPSAFPPILLSELQRTAIGAGLADRRPPPVEGHADLRPNATPIRRGLQYDRVLFPAAYPFCSGRLGAARYRRSQRPACRRVTSNAEARQTA